MIICCVNCAHCWMEPGVNYSTQTTTEEDISCAKGQYSHTLQEATDIVRIQRSVTKSGCPDFKPYTEETK